MPKTVNYSLPRGYKARAKRVFETLGALEAGQEPVDWVKRLFRAQVGSVGERWMFSRILGAKVCDIDWTPKYARFKPRVHHWPTHEGIIGPPRDFKGARVTNPGYSPCSYEVHYDTAIVDCLETAAKIAFVNNQRKAATACLRAMAHYATIPSKDEPDELWLKMAEIAKKYTNQSA